MSYFASEFDLHFKSRFSKSYTLFSEKEINDLGMGLLLQLTPPAIALEAKRIRSEIKSLIQNEFKVNLGHEESYNKYVRSEKLLRLFDSVSSLSSTSNKDKLMRMVYYRSRRSHHIKRAEKFANYEKVPTQFAELALEKNCIKTLVKFFTSKILNVHYSSDISNSVSALSESWLRNPRLLTPYKRTGEFREFLCILSSKNDVDEDILPPKSMRILLATCRFHLSVMDELHLNPKDLLNLRKKQEQDAESESIIDERSSSNTQRELQAKGKKFIKNYRKRHMMPLLVEAVDFDHFTELEHSDPLFKVKLALIDSN